MVVKRKENKRQVQMQRQGNVGEMMGKECRKVKAGMRICHSFRGEKFLSPLFHVFPGPFYLNDSFPFQLPWPWRSLPPTAPLPPTGPARSPDRHSHATRGSSRPAGGQEDGQEGGDAAGAPEILHCSLQSPG